MLRISAHIIDPFRKLRSFRKWDKGMDINPEGETSYTTQYREAFRQYVENEYSAKDGRWQVNKHKSLPSGNPIPSGPGSGSHQSTFHRYDLSSDDEEYLMLDNVAETTPGPSNCAALLMTAARLHLISQPEAPKNWGQIDPNLIDYHSDPMEISSTFWLLDITDWWRQREQTHSCTPISLMWRAAFALSYHMQFEWRPVFP